MNHSLKTCLASLAVIAVMVPTLRAQTETSSMSPTVGPSLPSISGLFNYSLSASELLQSRGYGGSGIGASTALSGNASYSSASVARPFSMLYAGGLLLGNQYAGTVRTFQDFSISQGLVAGAWIFDVSDSVSYLPQSPTTGLSGVPGVGDLGSQPVQNPSSGPAGGLLSNGLTNVSNALSGSVERRLTPLTSISGRGSWSMLRFPNGDGIENTQYTGDVGLNHKLDARDTISGNAVYATFSYGSGIDLSMQTRSLNVAFERVLSRKLSMSASAGPQWINSSNSALIPSRLSVAVNASLLYAAESTTASVTYVRGVNGGAGIQPGAFSDNIAAAAGRSYGRDWTVSLSADYTHTSSLVQTATLTGASGLNSVFPYTGGSGNTVFGGGQVTRRLSESLSCYGSYNLQHQSIGESLVLQNGFSGFNQTFGLGISFSPRSIHLGQF